MVEVLRTDKPIFTRRSQHDYCRNNTVAIGVESGLQAHSSLRHLSCFVLQPRLIEVCGVSPNSAVGAPLDQTPITFAGGCARRSGIFFV